MRKNKYSTMYYIGLIFLFFPITEGLRHNIFYLTIPTLIFTLAYVLLIHIEKKHKLLIALSWLYLLAYIFYTIYVIEGTMAWFLFFPCNLLNWKFSDRIKSYRPISFIIVLFLTTYDALFYYHPTEIKIMMILIICFICLFWATSTYIRKDNILKEELYQKNQHINLLTAENERNRISRDLHDTLGHTFAMLSLKSELALKQLEKEHYNQVAQQLRDIQDSSKDAMSHVRQLINDLNSQDLTSEIESIRELFLLSDIQFSITNLLTEKSLTSKIESAIVMIIRELSTNIIKHANAKVCHLDLKQSKGYEITMTDDGYGFGELLGNELHSIQERLTFFSGEVNIISPKNPTIVRVKIDERMI